MKTACGVLCIAGMRQALVLGFAALVAPRAIVLGCTGGDASRPPPAVDASSDAFITADASVPDGRRSFSLATGGLQLVVAGANQGLLLTPADLATDVDVLDVHQEYYGVPWDTFLSGQAPPAQWASVMGSLAASAKAAHKPVFLSVSMLDGARKSLAPKTVIQGGAVTSSEWSTPCFDFAKDPTGANTKAAYLAYVAWMLDEFSPAYFDMAIEVNLFFENCPTAAASLVDVANAAYDLAKAKNSTLIAFPSFEIEHLYGYTSATCPGARGDSSCFAKNYAQILSIKRDRFAMSSYPNIPGVFDHPGDLPADYFSRGAARANEVALISETGWNSTPVVVETSAGACTKVESNTEADTAAFLALILATARTTSMDLVDWWVDRDLVVSQLVTDCPCTFDPTWCGALAAFSGPRTDGGVVDTYFAGQLAVKGFGTMGLRDYAGNAKPTTLPIWQAAQATPIAR